MFLKALNQTRLPHILIPYKHQPKKGKLGRGREGGGSNVDKKGKRNLPYTGARDIALADVAQESEDESGVLLMSGFLVPLHLLEGLMKITLIEMVMRMILRRSIFQLPQRVPFDTEIDQIELQ